VACCVAHACMQRGEVARLLLEQGGADPRARSESTGYTPLHTCVRPRVDTLKNGHVKQE
jgi:ankyrin repeat protein